jgi:hypothetical protein
MRTQVALGGPLDDMTRALVVELIPEAKKLLERIDAEIADPSVRHGGIVHGVALQGAVAAGATIEAKLTRADGED